MYEKFKGSLGEFCEKYLNGEVFYQMDCGHAYEVVGDLKGSSLRMYYQSGVYTKSEPKWYENLGEGVLCWVWDYGDKSLRIITGYNEVLDMKYRDGDRCGWVNAEPLTEEEVMKYIWKGGL